MRGTVGGRWHTPAATQNALPSKALDASALAGRERYKRFFDLTVLFVAHVVLLPLWVVLWTVIPLLVWLEDRGPVFYRQIRAGRGGRPFAVLKFRTMVPGADSQGPSWTAEGDGRVTRVGRILRKTALDELPQVLSIWKGDMSLVGPRALALEEQRALEQKIAGFHLRLLVRPGLTGLSQVYNRLDDDKLKLQYDLEYIRNMNPFLDLKLLFLSVFRTLGARWDSRAAKGN